jgi:hypothetical protein
VSQRKRYYLLKLPAGAATYAPDSTYRRPTIDDHESLASLMLDAYTGTIDYDGETIDDARQEIGRYFAGKPLLECSNLCFDQGILVSACLIGIYDDPLTPLVGYIMTRGAFKRTGLAQRLLEASLGDLVRAGHKQVGAWITEGNKPSERLHLGLNFEPLHQPR